MSPAETLNEPPVFAGRGELEGRSWARGPGDTVPPMPAGPQRRFPRGHPAAYEAGPELVEAVNTALILDKPLLVTGNPGTGKTELAERIAYEFDLGPVLRFEAQSLSEANDLFYRFDYVQHMVLAKLVELGRATQESADPARFVQFGVLGRAILRAAPQRAQDLLGDLAGQDAPRRSVVLIDEIDKASRDFPNDLLNGIERMRFEIRELGGRVVDGAGHDSGLRPIVVITSNSERDLPAPFLRRCVYLHIPDPDRAQLAAIVRKRVLGDPPSHGAGDLPPLYARLLDGFVALRDGSDLRYRIGTSELLDLSASAQRNRVDADRIDGSTLAWLRSAIGSFAKHAEDREPVLQHMTQRLATDPGA